ncbi:MAG: xanthine dehydrogenase family protein subunit M [Deltaproteobacteria bacterium]|nr:xanthine dehydrogenase family protein subunit M [Deltaproteobacteria bacterium]
MYPNKFDYHRPASLSEATELMARYGQDARPLAGGQSLIPLMKLRLANPAVIVDLNGIPGLSYVRQQEDRLVIGALTCHSDVEDSEIVRNRHQMIGDAVRNIGDAQVRNLGTVGGSLVHCDPSGDWGPVLLALGGEVRCLGPAGERIIRGTDFFTDTYETARDPTEIVTEVRLRSPQPGAGGAYLKLERRSGDFAVVGVAVCLVLDANDVCREAAIGLGGVAPTYVKATSAESVLRGMPLSDAAIAEAARCLDAEIDPYSDIRAPAEYKRAMAKVFFQKAVELARRRATVGDS